MHKSIIVLLLSVCACGTPRSYAQTVPDSVIKRVEQRELPPDPTTEPVPDELPEGDWVIPIERGECLDAAGVPESDASQPCPSQSGIAISERRAYRDGLFRLRYKELRTIYESDRSVWSAHRELYEKRLELADKAISDLQPSWWDRNKLQIGVVGGVVLGVAASVAILAVTDSVQ